MPQDDELINLVFEVNADEDTDPEDLDNLRRELFNELKHTDVENINLVSDETAPEGTKSGIPIGTEIAVALLAPMIPETINYVYRWVKRREHQQVVIKSIIGGNEVEVIISGSVDNSEQLNQFMNSLTQSMGGTTTPQ